MRFSFLRILSAIFVLNTFCPLGTIGQSLAEKGLPFIRNYQARDYNGNPQNWCIIEDSSGLVYFGNQGYLLQYDGVKWKKIFFPGAIAVAIRSLDKDKNGQIYYGSTGDFGYLAKDSLGQTQQYSLKKYLPDSVKNFFDVWTTYATDKGIYFQSRERIFRVPKDKAGNFQEKDIKSWEPTTKFMYAFFLDGVYYVHQRGLGLFKMINDSLELIPGSEFLGKERMQVMLPFTPPEGNNGNKGDKQYLVGLFYTGLYVYDGKSFRPFKTEADPVIKNATLYKGIALKDGSFALSTTGKGVVIIDGMGKILKVINRDVGLQDESVYGMYFDRKGSLWLALDNGISRIEISSPLTTFGIQSGINTATLSIKRFEGTLYLGTTNGLLRLNQSNGKFEEVPGIPLTQIFTMVVNDNKLLVPNDGLFYVKDKKTNLIRASASGDLQMSGIKVLTSHPDILLGGATFGLAVFTKGKKVAGKPDSSQHWIYRGNIPGIEEGIWTFTEDSIGRIWVGTQNSTVFRLTLAFDDQGEPDLKKTVVQKFTIADGLGTGGGPVYMVKGKSYFIADSALYSFDETNKRFRVDTTFGSFPNAGGKDESYMVEDQSGRVWIRMGKEILVAVPEANGKYSIDKTPFLPIAGGTISQFYPEANGIIWVCTTDGLVRFDENLKKNYGESYKTLLRHITAGQETLNLSLSDNAGDGVNIPYKNNTLRFEYAAPFFEQEEKTKYETWLEGFDTGWSGWDNNSYKEYTNLPAGNYVFHVRAKNIYGKISEEANYYYTVSPPWSATWWAYLLYVLGAISLIYLITRYRTAKLHRERAELEKKVLERTHEVQVQAEELTTVNQISQALASQLNLDDLIKLVGEEMRQVFKAEIVYLAMLDKKTNMIHFPYQYGEVLPPIKLGQGLASNIINNRKPLLINEDFKKQIKQLGISPLGIPPSSYLGVPIPIDDEIIGVLSVQSTVKEDYFDEKDQRLLSTIAANVGVALKKARLFEEVKSAKLEAEEASKNAERANEAKSAFLSTVSHELRTPLTSVLGFAKIIKKRLEERIFPDTNKTNPRTEKAMTQVSENLEVVISEGERLTHLINDVLDLAKIEAGKMEWHMGIISIPEIVDRAIAATSSLFYNKNIVLKKFMDTGLPEISGDADKIIQVVVNLISNAVKFTNEGEIVCRVVHQGDEIITSIKDSGIGIAKQDHEAVFEQFKQVGGDTLTDKPKGTGLGLPICREIIEHHGGRIWLESEQGKGSTFFFALPVNEKGTVNKTIHLDDLVKQLKDHVAQSGFRLKDGSATILIVDDDDSIRSLLRQELTDGGYLIEEAKNGKEALESIRNHQPDLIILDVMMPEMNGFEVASILKNDPKTLDIPIIILSVVQDKARGYRIGVDRYLTKPIDTNQLFTEVGVLLEQGKSRKKVMIVDEDQAAVKTLTDVLQTRGYQVFESDWHVLAEKAIATQPDMIILNSVFSGRQEIVQTLRFEKGLENVLFLIYE